MIKKFKIYAVKSGVVSRTPANGDEPEVIEWAGSLSFARRKQAEPLIAALEKFGHEYAVVEETREVEIPDA